MIAAPASQLACDILNGAEIVGRCTLEATFADAYGNPRKTSRILVTISGCTGALPDSITLSSQSEVMSFIAGERELFIQAIGAMEHTQSNIEKVASLFGGDIDSHWPVAENPRQSWRHLARPDARQDMTPSSYAQALIETDIPADHARIVSDLQDAIENIARALIVGGEFDHAYHVVRIMTVGSTSRASYTELPVDFDLVIETELSQSAMDAGILRAVSEGIHEGVLGCPEFRAYCTLISPNGSVRVVRESIGSRGKESFVARYDLALPTASDTWHNFLDITFGLLPQITGYEIWLRRFFSTLAPENLLRLQREIRLAKKLLRATDGMYGSTQKGFRGHLVEQWIIQNYNYRICDAAAGTLDNALRLIASEATALDFTEFKSRFPVWHPGWWEVNPVPGHKRPSANLYDLLGKGDAVVAADKWRRLVGLAAAHTALAGSDAWSIPAITERARNSGTN